MATQVMKNNGLKGKHQRLILVLLAVAAMIGAALLGMSALKDQASFYIMPSELKTKPVAAGQAVRLGGMVVPGSIKRAADGVTINFMLGDGMANVPVKFVGIAPDLFREGSGATVDGSFDDKGVFQGTEIIAKHDERYMPREMGSLRYDEKTHKIENKPQ